MSFLAEEVYPRLDIGEHGHLDALKAKRHQRYWSFKCPACDHDDKGYYYPGSPWLNCSRSSCEGMSLWDYLGAGGASKQDLFRDLCRMAGVIPPERESPDQPAARLAAITRELLRNALVENAEARAYLERTRAYAPELWARLDLGYYPSARWLEAALTSRNCDLGLARKWGLLPEAGDSRDSQMARRLVGTWTQEDGSVRLWGRSIRGEEPKYLYSSGLKKRRPYLFTRTGKNTLVLAEGPFDVLALQALGVPAAGVGGAAVLRDQAAFMASQGIGAVIFFLDAGDDQETRCLQTLTALESVGIVAFFAWPTDAYKDVDEMRRGGATDAVRAALESAINAGAWLGRTVRTGDLGSHAHFETVRKALDVSGCLTAYSTAAFVEASGGLVGNPKAHALRAMAGLLDAGLTIEEARESIARRFGTRVTLEVAHG